MAEDRSQLLRAREIIGSFVENEGADAVVIIYSKVRKRKTETYLIPWGNAHTCNALIDYAYDSYNPPEPYDLDEEFENENEDDDD